MQSNDGSLKLCTACGNKFPATTKYFHSYKRNKDQLYSWCKKCKNERNQALSKRPDQQEHKSNYLKDWRQVNSLYDKERKKDWAKSHPERIQVDSRNWRARKKLVSGTHTVAQIQDLLKRQRHKCYYCMTKLQRVKGKYVYHIDHTFPLSRVIGTDIPANDINYLVLTCPSCNMKKHDKFPWEFAEGGRLL